jgi:hypothetical protein
MKKIAVKTKNTENAVLFEIVIEPFVASLASV